MLCQGDQVGDYTIQTCVQQTARHTVYEAHHSLGASARYRLTVWPAAQAWDLSEVKQRVVRMQAVRHPAMTQVRGWGVHEATGALWCASAWVQGTALRELVGPAGVPADALGRWFAGMGEGLLQLPEAGHGLWRLTVDDVWLTPEGRAVCVGPDLLNTGADTPLAQRFARCLADVAGAAPCRRVAGLLDALHRPASSGVDLTEAVRVLGLLRDGLSARTDSLVGETLSGTRWLPATTDEAAPTQVLAVGPGRRSQLDRPGQALELAPTVMLKRPAALDRGSLRSWPHRRQWVVAACAAVAVAMGLLVGALTVVAAVPAPVARPPVVRLALPADVPVWARRPGQAWVRLVGEGQAGVATVPGSGASDPGPLEVRMGAQCGDPAAAPACCLQGEVQAPPSLDQDRAWSLLLWADTLEQRCTAAKQRTAALEAVASGTQGPWALAPFGPWRVLLTDASVEAASASDAASEPATAGAPVAEGPSTPVASVSAPRRSRVQEPPAVQSMPVAPTLPVPASQVRASVGPVRALRRNPDVDDLRRVLQTKSAALTRCARSAGLAFEQAGGSVWVSLEVRRDGRLEGVGVARDQIGSKLLNACLTRVVGTASLASGQRSGKAEAELLFAVSQP